MRNHKEIFEALLAGKKLVTARDNKHHVKMENGQVNWYNGNICIEYWRTPDFSFPDHWSEWKDPNLVEFKDVKVGQRFFSITGTGNTYMKMRPTKECHNTVVIESPQSYNLGEHLELCDSTTVRLVKD